MKLQPLALIIASLHPGHFVKAFLREPNKESLKFGLVSWQQFLDNGLCI
jgi:hypothetical protein